MNKALERPVDSRVEKAYKDAYDKKTRKFTFGGVIVKIPTQAKEEDIKALCSSLLIGAKLKEINLLPSLVKVREQLLKGVKIEVVEVNQD